MEISPLCVEANLSIYLSFSQEMYFHVVTSDYHKDTEPLYHSFIYSLVSLLSGIYLLPAMHSTLFTLYVDMDTQSTNYSYFDESLFLGLFNEIYPSLR